MASKEAPTENKSSVDSVKKDTSNNHETAKKTEAIVADPKGPVKQEQESKPVDPEELIDMNTFDQLLDMDDEEDHEFSYSIVLNYFEQAEATFKDMDAALAAQDLPELSRLGHFLKGSSAAIGLKKVKATCEKIQNIGNRQDDGQQLEADEALKKIAVLLPQVKAEYTEAEEYLKGFYEVQQEGR